MRHFLLLVVGTLLAVPSALCEVTVKSGEKIAFLGDSITQQGKGSPSGYVNLVSHGLAANGIKIEVIGAGISGHKSNQMLARLEKDVLSHKPQWMTLSCGVNDVWHGEKGVPLEDYKKIITAIIDQAQAAGVKIVILTSTMIGEDPSNPNNQKLAPYNDFLRTLAKEKNCPLADLYTDMAALVAKANTPGKNALTGDGVHMAPAGDRMMASGVLTALGLDAAQLEKAREAWLDIPGTTALNFRATFSQREMQSLEKAAAAKNSTPQQLLDQEFQKIIESLKK